MADIKLALNNNQELGPAEILDLLKDHNIDELVNISNKYLLPGNEEERKGEKLGKAIERILNSAIFLFQVDTASLWYSCNDFETKEGQITKRIVFLDGKGAYGDGTYRTVTYANEAEKENDLNRIKTNCNISIDSLRKGNKILISNIISDENACSIRAYNYNNDDDLNDIIKTDIKTHCLSGGEDPENLRINIFENGQLKRDEYKKGLKHKDTQKNIMEDDDLGEYPNYKLYGDPTKNAEREMSGTSYVATYGIQKVAISDSLEKLQSKKKGKYDQYIYGTGKEAKAFDCVIIQPIVHEGKVIGVLKIEKRKAFSNSEPFKHGSKIFGPLLDCLAQIMPKMATVLNEKEELLKIMEYGSPGIGYAISIDQLDAHNITMNFVNEFKDWENVFNWAKEELWKFVQSIEGTKTFVYRSEPRIKTISSIVEKLIRHRSLASANRNKEDEEGVTSDNVFQVFKDIVGIRLIFRFKTDRREFCDKLVEVAKKNAEKRAWRMATMAHNQDNPRDSVENGDEKGYRAIHLWLQHEIPRRISDYYNIKKQNELVTAEIQMRTLMEDAWAQKSHPIFYKDKWRRREEAQLNFGNLFSIQGNQLYNIDEATETIKEMVRQIS